MVVCLIRNIRVPGAAAQLTTKGLSHTSGGDSDQDKIASLFNHGAAALPAFARPSGNDVCTSWGSSEDGLVTVLALMQLFAAE